MHNVRAELLVLRKRAATWVLLAIAGALTIFFSYGLPYVAFRNGTNGPDGRLVDLPTLLPGQLVQTLIGGFPFYLGVIALILGVLAFGSDYGWGTNKTLLLQQPNRTRLLLGKAAALGIVLAPYTLVVYLLGALSSVTVALIENQTIAWPGLSELARGFGAGWLLLGLWALFGALLATLSRGTALAIGLGILYALVIEGIISGFSGSLTLLSDLSQGFLRTNAYSLVAPLQTTLGNERGPGVVRRPLRQPLAGTGRDRRLLRRVHRDQRARAAPTRRDVAGGAVLQPVVVSDSSDGRPNHFG